MTFARRSQKPPVSATEAPSDITNCAADAPSPTAAAVSVRPRAILSCGTCAGSSTRPSQRRPSGAFTRRTEVFLSGRLRQTGSRRPVTSTRSRRIQGSASAISVSQAAAPASALRPSQADSSKAAAARPCCASPAGSAGQPASSRSSSSVVVRPCTTRAARPDLPLRTWATVCRPRPAAASSAEVRRRRLRIWKVTSRVSAPVTTSVRITSSSVTVRSSATISSRPPRSQQAEAAAPGCRCRRGWNRTLRTGRSGRRSAGRAAG